jgi:hypothetical protein
VVSLIIKNVQYICGRQSIDVNSNNEHQANKFGGGNLGVEAKIIFPVSSEAVMTSDFQPEVYAQLPIVPRVASGEGCSMASGCATCPFMKMNNLDAL